MIRRKVLMDLPEAVPNPAPVEEVPVEAPKESAIFKQKKVEPKKEKDDSLDVIPADSISAQEAQKKTKVPFRNKN